MSALEEYRKFVAELDYPVDDGHEAVVPAYLADAAIAELEADYANAAAGRQELAEELKQAEAELAREQRGDGSSYYADKIRSLEAELAVRERMLRLAWGRYVSRGVAPFYSEWTYDAWLADLRARAEEEK